MSQITLTLPLTPKNIEALCELLPRLSLESATIGNETRQMSFFGDAANEAMESEAPAAITSELSNGKSKEPPTGQDDLRPDPTQKPISAPDDTSAPSMTDLRALALKLSKAGKQAVIKKLFAKYGADKLSGVAEEHYLDLMNDLEAANAEA